MAETVKLADEATADLPEGFKITELGPLPEDWQVVPLDMVAVIGGSRADLSPHEPIPFIPMSLIPEDSLYITNWELRGRKDVRSGIPVREGDLLLAKITPCLENGKQGIVNGLPNGWAYASTEVYPIRALDSLDIEFLALYLKHERVRHNLASKMEGTTGRQRLPKSVLQALPIPLPPVHEQRIIVSVLRTVQRAKEATKKVLAAARELKKSLMRYLFTYGPVPVEEAVRVPLKETEVGLVPEHWRIVRVGEIASVRSGISFPPEYQGERKGDYPFFKVSDMNIAGNETYMRIAHNYISEEVRQVLGAKLFPASTIVFPKVGGAIHTNKKRMLQQASLIDNNIMGVTVTNSKMCIPGYLFCWLQTVNLSDLCNPGPLPSITAARIKNVSFPLAPLAEQYEICHLLAAVDRKIEAEETRMQALDALFNTLLHLLMTGRIRVEDIPLPEGGVVVAGASRE